MKKINVVIAIVLTSISLSYKVNATLAASSSPSEKSSKSNKKEHYEQVVTPLQEQVVVTPPSENTKAKDNNKQGAKDNPTPSTHLRSNCQTILHNFHIHKAHHYHFLLKMTVSYQTNNLRLQQHKLAITQQQVRLKKLLQINQEILLNIQKHHHHGKKRIILPL